MAITNIKRQQQTAQNTDKMSSNTPYTGMVGVSQNTANNLGNYQQGYQQSEKAIQAGKNLEATMANRPSAYQSKYTDQLDAIMEEIGNPQQFNYSFDGDELFKSYADEYTQRGKQAALDTMGQAAALTGGYGNSYAQAAANQQYQQYLLGLYDKGLDLYDRAYQRYKDNQAQSTDRMNALLTMDNRDYQRYQDEMANWQNDRDFAAEQASAISQMDYQQYQDMLTYYTGLAQVENAAYETEEQRQEAIREYEQDFAEKVRQYDTTLAENQRQFNENLSWDKEESYRDYYENQRQFNENLAENQRQYNSTLAENQRQYDSTLAENQRQYDTTFSENQRQYDTTLAENQRQYDTTLAENQRQYDTTMAWDQESTNRELAYNYVKAILENGGTPSQDLLNAAWLSAADAEALKTATSSGSGGTSGSNGNKPTNNNNDDDVVESDNTGLQSSYTSLLTQEEIRNIESTEYIDNGQNSGYMIRFKNGSKKFIPAY